MSGIFIRLASAFILGVTAPAACNALLGANDDEKCPKCELNKDCPECEECKYWDQYWLDHPDEYVKSFLRFSAPPFASLK